MPTLDWLNRAEAFTTAARVPYRLLEQVSVHTSSTPSPRRGEGEGEGRSPHDNLLIQGDNLEALKSLLPFYRGQVKCIFIDPPYNTKSAFEHYDDNLEHAQWLLARVLEIASGPRDLVLDSFLGSGTTSAVAHKMGRCWIGIEMGEHASTHCLPRLQKVLDGEQGGISKAVGWEGGGGFRFMKLGAPVFDKNGRIHPDVRFATLAAYVWQQQTREAFDAATAKPGTPYLGTHYVVGERPGELAEGKPTATTRTPRFACYLLFNGILGDKRPASGTRNLEQVPEFAFWLPTATDYFYPDFVAELNDGHLLVVEYKGDAYATNDDSREKRLVGERWAQTTGQRFVMVEKLLNGMDMAAQIRTAIRV